MVCLFGNTTELGFFLQLGYVCRFTIEYSLLKVDCLTFIFDFQGYNEVASCLHPYVRNDCRPFS